MTGTNNSIMDDSSTITLNCYSRLWGHKHLFAPSDSDPAQYFIRNPVPHRHHGSWRPIFYRGENPKYTPDTTAIGRARRSAMWSSFRVWLGDGVHEVLENENRKKLKKKAERKEKWRKRFRMKPKPPKEPLEDEKEVLGKVVLFRMRRAGFWSRTVVWEIEGVEYQWSGTRMFGKGGRSGVKGWSHDLKLVKKSDHVLMATFQKDRWATFSKSQKTGSPPNKKKNFTGKLQIRSRAFNEVASGVKDAKASSSRLPEMTGKIDDAIQMRKKSEDEKDLNIHGPHSGNLTEDAVVISCWIVLEAEHRLRWKLVDLLEEIGESFDGG